MKESEILQDLSNRIEKFVEEGRYSRALDLITTLKEIGETTADFDEESWNNYEKQVKNLQNKDMTYRKE